MTALSQPSLRTRGGELAAPPRAVPQPRRAHAQTGGALATLAALFGFFAFMPYPAIPVGQHSALQLGDIFSLFILMLALMRSWKGKPFLLLPVLLMPMCLSVIKVALLGDGDLELSLKSFVTTAISMLAIIAAQFLAPRHFISLMKGIAVATIVHTLIGVWQLYSFAHGQFPLLFLYINPSFLSVQETVDTIIQYVQRPFGLFPEPSAMSSSLAPWTLLWIAEILGLVRFREKPTRNDRLLFTTAALGSLFLIISSRSGHASITMAALSLFAVVWFLKSKATLKSYLAIVAVFGIALPLLMLMLLQSMGTRIEGPREVDQSWQDRANSLWEGLMLLLNSGPASLLVGIGQGMVSPRMASSTEYETVWSVSLMYLYQTGLVGLLVMVWLANELRKVWRKTGKSIVFAAIVAVWLVGITITTSYSQLLPIWIALGCFTVWPSICVPAGRRRRRGIASARRPRPIPHFKAPAIDQRPIVGPAAPLRLS